MSPLPKRVGSAEEEVLMAVIRRGGSWNTGGPSLHESRNFTVELLDRLAAREFVETYTKPDPDRTVYLVTARGHKWASERSRSFLR